jgi:hypothetical protein
MREDREENFPFPDPHSPPPTYPDPTRPADEEDQDDGEERWRRDSDVVTPPYPAHVEPKDPWPRR